MQMEFCNKCQVETDRYACGKCKPCTRARDVKWKKINRDKVLKYKAIYRELNREKLRLSHAKYRSENIDAARLRSNTWKKANPELVRSSDSTRRARKLNAEGTHTAADIRNLLILQKSKCACCKKSIKGGYHVDHNMPLARGGSNDRLNLQLLCALCNLQKNAKHPIDFMQSRGFLL